MSITFLKLYTNDENVCVNLRNTKYSLIMVKGREKYKNTMGEEFVPTFDLSYLSVRYGDVKCLEYLRKNESLILNIFLVSCAICENKIHCLRYLIEIGCPSERNVENAVNYRAFECFKYLLERKQFEYKKAITIAIRLGLIDYIKYAHEIGVLEFNLENAKAAIIHGFIDCLRFLCENGCPLDVELINMTIEKGHYNCFEYLLSINCPVDGTTIQGIIYHNRLMYIYLLHKNVKMNFIDIARISDKYNDCTDYIYRYT